MAERDPPSARLPSHVEVGGLLRQVEAAGGFATVLAKGEADSGALLVVLTDRGRRSRAWERMPSPAGHRVWTRVREDLAADPGDFAEWLSRRQQQDPDLWIVELDIPDGERFIR